MSGSESEDLMEDEERRGAELSPDLEFPEQGIPEVTSESFPDAQPRPTQSIEDMIDEMTTGKKRKRDEDDEGDQKKKKRKKPKKQQLNKKAMCFFFTENNPTGESVVRILNLPHIDKWAFQEEKGGVKGVPHLQGCVTFSHRRTINKLRKATEGRVHWEIARNIEACAEYCTKLDTRNGRIWIHGFDTKGVRDERKKKIKKPKQKPKLVVVDPMDGLTPYHYQRRIIDLIKTTCKPGSRKIYWFWSQKGNIGKSALTKHLCIKYGTLIIGGTWKDAFYAITQKVIAGVDPKAIVFDLPRNQGNKISYTAIEGIKNGLFFSPKYESGMCVFNTPHIVIFANEAPNMWKLSEDRWIVKQLDDEKDLAHIKDQTSFKQRQESYSTARYRRNGT